MSLQNTWRVDPDFQKHWFMIITQFFNGLLSEVLSAHDNPVPDFL